MPNSQDKLLVLFAALLQKSGIKYCLVGGLAANAYASRDMFRETKDIDFAVDRLSKTKVRKLLKEAQKASLPKLRLVAMRDHNEPSDPMPGADVNSVENPVMYGARAEGVMVDFLLPNNIWVSDAIRNSQSKLLFDQEIPVIAPEELVAAKIISFADRGTRRKDLQDLRQLCKRELEIDRIERIISMVKLTWRDDFADVLTPEIAAIVKAHCRGRR